MRRLLSAFASQYLGAAIGGALTVFLFLTKKWEHIDVVFYLVVPLIILSATGVGFYIGGPSQSADSERPAPIRALVGLAGAFLGMIVMSGTVGCALFIAYFVIGRPPVSTTYENIGVLCLVAGSTVGALGGFVITRGA